MKNLTLLISFLFCMFICFSSCGDDATNNPDLPEFTIYPGQGINNLNLGDLGGTVERELGDGYEPVVNVGSSGNATYNYFNNSKGVDIIFGQYSSGDFDIDTLLIKSINLFDNFDGITELGIKIGSTRAEVIAAYGEPDIVDMWANVYSIGMLISYDEMDRVQDITILEI